MVDESFDQVGSPIHRRSERRPLIAAAADVARGTDASHDVYASVCSAPSRTAMPTVHQAVLGREQARAAGSSSRTAPADLRGAGLQPDLCVSPVRLQAL